LRNLLDQRGRKAEVVIPATLTRRLQPVIPHRCLRVVELRRADELGSGHGQSV
jgi:hypothetical protein